MPALFHYRFSADKRVNTAGWFLVISYGFAAPAFALAEYTGQVMSLRFNYPPEFIYLVSLGQVACAIALLVPALRIWSIAVLMLISVGAVASHVRIGSPLTSIPAIGYTVLQYWFAVRLRHQDSGQTGTSG